MFTSDAYLLFNAMKLARVCVPQLIKQASWAGYIYMSESVRPYVTDFYFRHCYTQSQQFRVCILTL